MKPSRHNPGTAGDAPSAASRRFTGVERLESRVVLSATVLAAGAGLGETSSLVLNSVADAYVRDGPYAGQNFGTASQLLVKGAAPGGGYVRTAYLKFDLTGVSPIRSAVLQLYGGEQPGAPEPAITVGAFGVPDSSWGEGSITAANAPAAGASAVATATVAGTTPRLYQLDVTSYLQQQQTAGAKFVAIAVEGTAFTGGMVGFSSREAGAIAPQLLVSTTPTPPPTPGTVTHPPSADAYIQDGPFAGNNYGSATQLLVKGAVAGGGYVRTAYLKFDLSGVAPITSATLKLVGAEVPGAAEPAIPVAVYPVANSTWGEGTIKQANAPAIGATPVASVTVTGTAPQTYSFDLTSYLKQQQSAGATSVTVAVRGTTFTKGMVAFNSRESGPNGPQLVLDTGTPNPPPTPTAEPINFAAGADAYVQNGTYANTNYGSAQQLLVKQAVAPYNRVAYLSFDLTRLTGTSAANATLRLFGGLQSGSNPDFKVNVVGVSNSGWSENTLTANNAPATGAVLASATVPDAVGRFYTFDLTRYVNQQLAAGQNVLSVAVTGTASTFETAAFNSRQASSNGPQLTVTPAGDGDFTPLAPSRDSRVIYVDDTPGGPGKDTNDGLSASRPVFSWARGVSLLRQGFPDWVLLKRGTTQHTAVNNWNLSGRSAAEPMVIGSFGDPAAPRPRFVTGLSAPGFSTDNQASHFVNGYAAQHVALTSVEFTPGQPNVAVVRTTGFFSPEATSDFLIEDCVFRSYQDNIVLLNAPSGVNPNGNFRIRRSVVEDAYGANSSLPGQEFPNRSQGLYAEGVHGLLLEQNVFDHNGWTDNIPNAGPSLYDQSIYLQYNNTGVQVLGNIIAEASGHGLQVRAGGIVKDNLFLNDPFGMSFGYINTSPVVPGGVSGEIANNVFLGSVARPWDSGNWALEVGNTSAAASTSIHDNLIVGNGQGDQPAIRLRVTTNPFNPEQDAGLNNLTLEHNTVYGWSYGLGLDATFVPGGAGRTALNNLTVRDNDFQQISAGAVVAHGSPFSAASENWGGDRYDATAAVPPGSWFTLGTVSAVENGPPPSVMPLSIDGWRQAVEPTATAVHLNYADPTRSAATYNQTIGGSPTLQAFLAGARAQSKAQWQPAYSAAAVESYVRGGFAVA